MVSDFTLAVAPLVGLLALVAVRHEPAKARQVAMAAAGLACFHAAVSAWDGSGDATSQAVQAFVTLGTLANLRGSHPVRDAALLLLSLAGSALVFAADDLRVVALGWALPPLAITAVWIARPDQAPRAWKWASLSLGSSAIAFMVAAMLLGAEGTFSLDGLTATSPSRASSAPLLWISLAVVIRLGVPPFHTWFAEIASGEHSGVAQAAIAILPGISLLCRAGIGLSPHVVPHEAEALRWFGSIGMLYAAVMVISTRSLRRLVVFAVLAQSSWLVVGIGSVHVVSIAGAYVLGTAVAIGAQAQLFIVDAVEARIGPVDVRFHHGLAAVAPRLSATIVLSVLAFIALPGSLAFVGEDLLLRGLLEEAPLDAGLVLFATALIAIGLLRGVLRTCFGPARDLGELDLDMTARERPLGLAVLLLFVLGLLPSPLLARHEDEARALRDAWTSDIPPPHVRE